MGNYKIRFLEYASANYPSQFFFGDSYDSGKLTYISHGATLLEGGGKNILIDSGLDVTKGNKALIAEGGQIQNLHSPEEMLAGAGLTPSDIDAVIVTHAHFDHIGGIGCYPKAKIYLQKKEAMGFLELLCKPKSFGLIDAYDPYDLHTLIELGLQGRVFLLDGDADNIFPGIHVRVVEMCHSFASQVVLVDTDDTRLAFIGDEAVTRANFTGVESMPFFIPNTKYAMGGKMNLLNMYERLLGLVDGDTSRLIMTHDCEKFTSFPTITTADGLHIAEICKGD